MRGRATSRMEIASVEGLQAPQHMASDEFIME